MTGERDWLWLNGERAGEHHLLDLTSGQVVTTAQLGREIRTTAGMGRRCGDRFVAVYVAPDGEAVVLQVERQRFPLDGQTIVTHQTQFCGLMSAIAIKRPGMDPLSLRRRNIASALLRRVDPSYDDLDASSDDFLADIADIAASERRIAWIKEVKDPEAGPWEAAP
jgi:hypothetical protein